MSDIDRELVERMAALEQRLGEVEARAAEAEARAREGGAGPLSVMDAVMTAVLPPEARGHLRAARKEQLLAMRSLVDNWIDRVDRAAERADKPRRRHESIPLEDA